MKTLIVKMSDEEYDDIKSGKHLDVYTMSNIIHKGIEIPEDTGKIIDVDALEQEIMEIYHNNLPEPLAKLLVDIMAIIDAAEPIVK